MGSTTFQNEYRGKLSVQDAYAALVQEALSERGHDPYNGTISTTRGVYLVPGPPMTLDDAAALSDTRVDNLSKWENCEAIALAEETPAEYERMPDQRVTVTVSGTVYNDPALLTPILLKAATGVKGARVTSYRLDTDTAKVDKRVDADALLKEKAETRYFIVPADPNRSRSLREDLEWDKGHPTQAAARAALSGILRYSWQSIPTLDAEIVGITRRASGAPLVKATVSASKVSGEFVVQLQRETKAATRGTARAGYLFYGWAAC